jgi:hypothetical protein
MIWRRKGSHNCTNLHSSSQKGSSQVTQLHLQTITLQWTFWYSVVINRYDPHLYVNEPNCQASNTMISLVYHHCLNHYYTGKASRRLALSEFNDNHRPPTVNPFVRFHHLCTIYNRVLPPGARPSIAQPSAISSDHRNSIAPLPISLIKIQACSFSFYSFCAKKVKPILDSLW